MQEKNRDKNIDCRPPQDADIWDFIGDHSSKDLVAIKLHNGRYLIVQGTNCNFLYCTKGILDGQMSIALRSHIISESAINMENYKKFLDDAKCYSTMSEEFERAGY